MVTRKKEEVNNKFSVFLGFSMVSDHTFGGFSLYPCHSTGRVYLAPYVFDKVSYKHNPLLPICTLSCLFGSF